MDFVPINLDDLKNDYLSGCSIRYLARKYKTSKLTIKRKLNKSGVDTLSSKEFITKHNKKHIKESSKRYDNYHDINQLYEEGMSINQIVNKLNISEPKVRKLIKNKRNIDKGYIVNRFTPIYEKVKPGWLCKNNLYDLYHNKKWSITDIAEFYTYDNEAIRSAFIKYGIDRRNIAESSLFHYKKNNYRSNLERAVKIILDDNNIDNDKFVHGGYEFDFVINDKLLIEVNGLYYHLKCNKKINRDRDKYKYWFDNLRHKYDYKVLWEHYAKSTGSLYDILDEWINFPSIKIDKSIIEFKEITYSNANDFCMAYHYHNKTRKGDYYGAFYDGKLISVAVFSPITRKQSADRLGFNSNEVKELSRFCISGSYNCNKNLASYLLSRFEKIFITKYSNIRCLIAFSDLTEGHVGTIYKATNWTFDGETKESYYYEKEGMKWHKKTIWQHAKSLKMKESEFSDLFCLNRINTLKKYRFIKLFI